MGTTYKSSTASQAPACSPPRPPSGRGSPPKPLALHRAAGRLSPALPPFPHVGTVPTAALCLRPVAVMCQALVPLTHGNPPGAMPPSSSMHVAPTWRGTGISWYLI